MRGFAFVFILVTENTGDPYFWLLRKENSVFYFISSSVKIYSYIQRKLYLYSKREDEKNHNYPLDLSGPLSLITENKVSVVVIELIVEQLA